MMAEDGRFPEGGTRVVCGRTVLDAIAWLLLCLFVFTMPWEKSVMVPGVGTLAKTLGLVAFLAGAAAVAGRRTFRPPNIVLLVAGLFVAWSATTWLWSLDRAATLARSMTLAQLLALLWLVWELCRGAARQRRLMAAYVCGAVVGSAIAFTRYLSGVQTYWRRYAAVGFDPNDFGMILALAVPMVLYLAFVGEGRKQRLWIFAVVAIIPAILLTGSRTSLIAMFVGLSFGLVTWRMQNRPLRIATVLLVALIAVSLARVAPAPTRGRLSTIPQEVTRGSLNDRKQIWKAGAKVWMEHPLLGVGSDAYPVAVRPLIGEPAIAGFRFVAHNTLLSVLVECGAVGAAIYGLLMLCLVAFLWMLPPWERALWGVMLAVWATGAMTLTWEHYKPTWLLFGFVMTAWGRAWHRGGTGRLRVLEVIPTLKRAGAERMVVSLARGLHAGTYEVRVVSLYDAFEGGFEKELEDAGVAVVHLGKRKGFDPRMVWRLWRTVGEFAPDVIHSHSYLLRYVYPAAVLAGKPAMVHTVHNVAAKEADRAGQWLNRVAYRGGVQPVAVGAEVARSFPGVYGFEVAETIPNGVDLSPFALPTDGAAWKAANGFAPTQRLAISVARLDAQKNPLGLVEGFARGLGGESEWQLVLVGEGPLTEDVRRRAAELGIAARMHLLGLRADVAEAMQASDLFAMASDWEGTPLAVIEAMAAGLPVVATAVGGVPELVVDGETGVLVPPGDAAAFGDALARVAKDAAGRARMSEAAKARATRFGAETMVAAYAKLFDRMTGAARRNPGPLALLTTQLARGGAEVQVALLAREFSKRGWKVNVVSLREPLALIGEVHSAGAALWSPRMMPGRINVVALLRLANHLRAMRPVAVHAHLFHANLIARCLRLICPVPVLISTIHSLAETGRTTMRIGPRDALYRGSDWLSDATVCVSEAVRERHLASKAVSFRRARVIPNGGDASRFAPCAETRARMRAELGVNDRFVWLAVGRLMWKKDYPTMLRAMAGQTADAVLLIAGEGPDGESLRSLAGEVGGDLRFLGMRDDVAALMQAADGFVLSSVVEGLPMVLIEASLAGLPCVATDVGGVREIVIDGYTGVVVPPENAEALGEAMRQVSTMPRGGRQEMGDAARREAARNFSIETAAGRWQRLTIERLRENTWQVTP